MTEQPERPNDSSPFPGRAVDHVEALTPEERESVRVAMEKAHKDDEQRGKHASPGTKRPDTTERMYHALSKEEFGDMAREVKDQMERGELRLAKPDEPGDPEYGKRCPRCGSHNIVPIAYGAPAEEMAAAAKAGEIVLGGCFVEVNSPSWWCRACKHEWGNWLVGDE